MSFDEISEPYIDDDQIIEMESYMDELVGHMLQETENGQEPVIFYRQRMTDAITSIAELLEIIPQLTFTETKAEERRMKKVLPAMRDLMDYVLLMAHAFETGLPDAEVVEEETSTAILEVQTNATICAMSLLDSINALGFNFFVQRNSDDFENEDAQTDILAMLAGLFRLCEHVQVDLFDVMYANS